MSVTGIGQDAKGHAGTADRVDDFDHLLDRIEHIAQQIEQFLGRRCRAVEPLISKKKKNAL